MIHYKIHSVIICLTFIYIYLLAFCSIAKGVTLASDSLNLHDSTSIVKDTTNVDYHPQFKPEITIKKIKNNSIELDGKINDEGWKNAAVVKNFVEIDPRDNAKPNAETEVMITYDDNNIYFAFINYESDISSIRANMCDRDKIFNDDFCGFMLDTYGEAKQAYEIFVNPYGVQGDLFRDQNGNEDANYDMIWYAESKIYKDKWVAEIKIPFKSLRFPDKNIQEWKIDIFRNRPRVTREQISWAAIDRDVPSLLTQLGTIKGIKHIKSGKNLEILPYAMATQAGYLKDNSNPNSGFTNEKVKGKGGLGVKYSFTSNLSGEATFNPDFSQVESDAAQISVNSSFALYYPEKRPLFLEGQDIFKTQYKVVYTRSINDPLYAGKLLGKIEDVQVGYILGYDQHTPFVLPYEEHTDVLNSNKKSLSNILRLKKSLKDESYLGFLATDRRIEDASNSVVGFDGLLKFLDNYYFKWQMLRFFSRELTDTSFYWNSETFGQNNYTGSFDGQAYAGFGGYLDIQRNARYWNFDLSYSDVSTGARADNGFLTSNDYRTLSLYNGYYIYTEQSSFCNQIIPQVMAYIRYDYSGKFKELVVNPELNLNLKNQISIYSYFLLVNDEDYGGILHKNVHRGEIQFDALPNNFISYGATFEIGRYIARLETPPFVGFGFNGEIRLTLRPTDRLSFENTYDYSELARSYRGQKLFAGYIFRDRAVYQFSRGVFLRLITQYDSFNGTLEIDPLISFKLNPFTIFYLGSTHEITDFGSSPDHSRYIQSNRQFFAKIQYLWRM